jgi:hypothetical protein
MIKKRSGGRQTVPTDLSPVIKDMENICLRK